jgi:hypothetical protein
MLLIAATSHLFQHQHPTHFPVLGEQRGRQAPEPLAQGQDRFSPR